ncbi:MAG: hypothetical protein U5L76_04555 [Patescibacteria group bacterium]|nr:hypothetical protein [Patescibacteria group bacterium]
MKRSRASPDKKKAKRELDILYLVCAAWFFFQFALVLTQFFKVEINGQRFISRALIFGLLLLFYWIKNLFGRLKGKIIKRKKGHLFVLVWIIFMLILMLTSYVSQGRYKIPFKAWENLIYILTVFSSRNLAKIIIRWKKKNKKFLKGYTLTLFLGPWLIKKFRRWKKIKLRRTSNKLTDLKSEGVISNELIRF